MEDDEFDHAVREVVRSLSSFSPDHAWDSVLHLLDHGEEGEAMDVLVAIIVRFDVPVTVGQRERIRELMGEFEFTEASRGIYRYLSDSEMLDRMIVVDNRSSS